MPRDPSARCLQDRSDLYNPITTGAGLDPDGALSGANYGAVPDSPGLACGWNPEYTEREDTEQRRVSALAGGLLVFAADPGCTAQSKFVITPAAGGRLTVFAEGPAQPMAGLGPWGVMTRARL